MELRSDELGFFSPCFAVGDILIFALGFNLSDTFSPACNKEMKEELLTLAKLSLLVNLNSSTIHSSPRLLPFPLRRRS